MNLRNEARQALSRAKLELSSNVAERFPYAALELRMALEALIYEVAESYKEEIADSKAATWQPKALLEYLLEIDPYADKTASISFGEEEVRGVPAKEMKSLGTDRRLSRREIKKNYSRLGSFLHTPTIKQRVEGKSTSSAKVRERCEEVVAILEEVLASPVWNANFSVASRIECGRCDAPIVRRLPPEPASLGAHCPKCGAGYEVTSDEAGEATWKAGVTRVRCPTPDCEAEIPLWKDQLKAGFLWDCSNCGKRNRLVLSIDQSEPPPADEAEAQANSGNEA